MASSVAGVVVRENQRASPLSESEETEGVGPEDSARGNGENCDGASNSTNIVAEVSRIAGPPGIGPFVLSAASITMTGSRDSR